mgnify:CR=1 FL=1
MTFAVVFPAVFKFMLSVGLIEATATVAGLK